MKDFAGASRLGRPDALPIALLVSAASGVPLWLAAASGSIGLPTSDDWVYAAGAKSLFISGLIQMPQHSAASVGQLVLVQPLLQLSGGHPWAFTAFGLAMSAIGAAATYLLVRRFVGVGFAVLIVLLVVAFPGLARASASFMTDVPSFALMMLCLLQGVRWLDGRTSRVTLVTSLGAGVLAVSIREFAIAAPIAVLTAAWLQGHLKDRMWLSAMTGAFVAGVAGVLLFAASIPGREASTAQLFRLLFLGPTFATLAAVLLPALALGVGRRIANVRPQHVLLGAFVAVLIDVVPGALQVGNMWMESGFAGDLLLSGDRPTVIDIDVWALSRRLASFGVVLLVLSAALWGDPRLRNAASTSGIFTALLRELRKREGLLVLFTVGYSAEMVLFAPFFVYDRYLMPLVPVAAILLVRGRPQLARLGPSLAMAQGALAWLAISALLIAANSFAYDAARWRAGVSAIAVGYDARRVDAGYEWIGAHSSGLPSPGAPADNMIWRDSRWALIHPCAIVSNGPIDDSGFSLIDMNKSAYRRYLFFGPEEALYLYGSVADQSCTP